MPQTTKTLLVFEGYTDDIEGAVELFDGRLLSWSKDKTLRLWDGQTGECLEVVAETDAPERHPELLHARAEVVCPNCVLLGFFLDSSAKSVQLCHRTSSAPIAYCNADSEAVARCLLPNGSAIVTQANGQVCILKLNHGKHRITLAEADVLIASQMRKTE